MQGFNDFAGPQKNDPSFRMYSISLKARQLLDLLDVQLGRFYVFSGAARGLIDGFSVKASPFQKKLSISGFYGRLAPADRSIALNDAGNTMIGLHISGQPTDALHASLSFARKQFSQKSYRAIRTDSLFNPLPIDFNPAKRTEDIVSADARYDVEGYGDVYARYDYDVETKAMARMNAFGRFRVREDLAVTAEYLQREPRIYYQSIFSVFAYSTIKDINAGLEYGLTEKWNLFANYGTISYGNESSQRITVGVNGDYISASFSKNISDRSDLDAASINAGYPLLNNMLTPTLLVSYAHYKLDESAPTHDAIGVAGGLVYRPLSSLIIDTQVQWMNNKVYANDVRLFLRVSYVVSQRLNLF
jgi:hypothetical protein